MTLTDNSIDEDPQELQDPQQLLCCKLTLFGFLLMFCDIADDEDKISKENFCYGRPRFMLPVT